MARARRFIETHWLFFAFQGIISILFGAFILFTNITVVQSLVAIIGVSLLCLGVIEIFSMLYRKHYGNSLALSLILAASEVIIAMMLLFTQDYNMAWALTLLAIYTIGRGVLELILAFTAVTDKTDRFMWATCGVCGAIIGIVILNSGGFLDQTAFTKFFSAYMMIYGVTNLFYGIHNRNELAEQKEARKIARAARLANKNQRKQKRQEKRKSRNRK
ncbi:DUF308 domain-containing protein [Candidatus Saccharibacteria bacterium]|nr:DUF308 domain-containing protein [Candidatus Saccharibacteria bacterium]